MRGGFVPGDVALATVHGEPGIRIMATSGVEWVTHQGFAVSDRDGDTTGHVADIRPLVVIDPESGSDVKRMMDAVLDHGYRTSNNANMQAALRSLIADPKPEEPQGLGAVVEDADGAVYIRRAQDWTDTPWVKATAAGFYEWAEITAVRVLSEGVMP